ncbi:MAG: DUF362 domain-containing protein [Bacteroidales bacterium]|nr:DUF362 domain-containing protein [Bacteroidales bacterium]
MKRRDFLKKSIGAGIFAGSFIAFGGYGRIFANTTLNKGIPYDLVAVKDGQPDKMFDRAMEAMGGMQKFVKPNQTVVVKPNIGWDVVPEKAANTNPTLVQRIIKHCFDAGAKKVYVFDHTCDNWQKSYKNSGIEKAAKDAGAKVAPGHTEGYYEEVNVPKGKKLTKTKEHELIQESDVFINVPILKNHGSARLTVSMKNLMGIVWDRRFWHRNNLHQCIADFASYRKPDLNVVDAYRVMLRNGPKGVSTADVRTMRYQIVSDDMVAADTAAAKIFGTTIDKVDYIKIAGKAGYGESDLTKLKIGRFKL